MRQSKHLAGGGIVALAIVSLLATVMYNVFANLLPAWWLGVAGVLAVGLILGNVWIVLTVSKSEIVGRLDTRLRQLEDWVRPKEFPWLVPCTHLDDIERNLPPGSEVWVVSPDLLHETDPEGSTIEILKSTAARGVHYTYLVPNTAEMRGASEQLRQHFAKAPDMLDLEFVEPNKFDLMAATNLTIYNPRGTREKPPQAFMELPVEGEGGDRGWWIRMAAKYANKFIGNISNTLSEREQRSPARSC